MAGKGSQFERDICRQLSLWWTKGERDDVFWRTPISGGRATMRAKTGKDTFGANGDIQAVDPIGRPLLKTVAIELKRGYSKHTVADLLDKPEKAKNQLYEDFFEQAERERKGSGAIGWWLITKRDRRDAIIFMPKHIFKGYGGHIPLAKIYWDGEIVCCEKLNDYLETTEPEVYGRTEDTKKVKAV